MGERRTRDPPLGVEMPRRDHLREVDDDGLAVLPPDKNVELVEVTMDEARSGEPNEEVHQL